VTKQQPAEIKMGENHKKEDSNLIFAPLFNTIALGLDHKNKKKTRRKMKSAQYASGDPIKKNKKMGGNEKYAATELRRGDNGRRRRRRRVRTRGL
jgi:hypothetical protein